MTDTSWAQAMAWAAFNGAGLAFVLPCAQSVLADYYIPEQRGRAFGFMFTLAALGKPGLYCSFPAILSECMGKVHLVQCCTMDCMQREMSLSKEHPRNKRT